MVDKSKILIFGATGYLGQHMINSSLFMGHPTYAYVRPTTNATDPSRLQLLREYNDKGVEGELDEHEKLIAAIRAVDVVISTLAIPQHPEQTKIITAIKEAGNIKRFVPSEYGNDVDRVTAVPPFQRILDNKKKIRRAVEAAGIPYTVVSANSLMAYFVDYFFHPRERKDEVIIYGSGKANAVLNYEEDVAAYTIMGANDPRTCNRVIHLRPPGNVVSTLDLVALWEHKSGRSLKKIRISEEDVVKLTKTLPLPENVSWAILHNIFVEGAQLSFELGDNDLEASKLYPDYKYTSISKYVDRCLVAPVKVKLSTFA
ncbi:Isoeugenol synthase 1 [Asimina triloba]